MDKTYSRTQRFTVMACLSAVAFLLMFIEFPLIPVASYLKLDFSDVPILIGTVIYGPWSGIIIAVVKCLLHGIARGMSPVELLGLFANLCTSIAMILPVSWSFHHEKWSLKKRLVISGLLATIIMTVVMTLFNYYVLTPAYMQMFNWHPSLPIKQLMLVGVVPFNLIKGILVSLIFGIIVIHLQWWLKRQTAKNNQ
ncbi:ECF transporter S component [Limosilactobacillus caecicola]|uniref:ECF transporter S component n=1 Tax=Limosilactobacillus caecicola TaxID=2941332 RepID=UPI00203D7117|nr:ECF transporter S component [Limosilactobacillus caecicola]